MNKALFSIKLLFCFLVITIRYTAIYWTYCSTLRRIVKAYALSAFISYYKVIVITNSLYHLIGIYLSPTWQHYFSF